MQIDDVKKLVDKYGLKANFGVVLYLGILDIAKDAEKQGLSLEEHAKNKLAEILHPYMARDILGE